MKRVYSITLFIVAFMYSAGCEGSNNDAAETAQTGNDTQHPEGEGLDHSHGAGGDHRHDHGSSTGHTEDESGGDHHGAPVELGSTTIGNFNVRAARDEGAITPGGDAPVDVWLTPANGGDTSTVVAVRFWIGTEDGHNFVKAKAEIENEPNHWHTHAEVPNPLPVNSKLWIEIETTDGNTTPISFDLKL